MNSLRARSVPAQLIVGMPRPIRERRRDQRVVADRGTHDHHHALLDELGEGLLDRERGTRRESQPRGVDELDVAIESATVAEVVDGEPHDRLACAAERRLLLGRVGHVVQDADAYRCSHGMQHRMCGRARIEATRH